MTQPQAQPPPGWQPPPPPQKKHTARNVILVLTGLAVLGLVGCVALLGGIGNEIEKQDETEHTVVYKVTGTSKKAALTYTTDGGTTTEQANGVTLPWSKTIKVKGLFQVVQVMAQNEIGQRGKVTCTITYDGKQVKTATATGEAAIASCDYTP